jgi:hypothetical protein
LPVYRGALNNLHDLPENHCVGKRASEFELGLPWKTSGKIEVPVLGWFIGWTERGLESKRKGAPAKEAFAGDDEINCR